MDYFSRCPISIFPRPNKPSSPSMLTGASPWVAERLFSIFGVTPILMTEVFL